MASMSVSSPSDFAPTVRASFATLGLSALRLLGMLATYENPFLWSIWAGRKNERADIEGPYYVIGAPNRQIAEGKGIMARQELLTRCAPFLMTIRVLDNDGLPLPGATLDWWQADNEGSYYFKDYTLRGIVKTDSNGYAEVLSVAPGLYGQRAGHIHLRIQAPPGAEGRWEELTTQMYVCRGNDEIDMKNDIVNYMRKARVNNMVKAWSIPAATGGTAYMNFPELSTDDTATQERVGWWNAKLAGTSDLKIAAGASTEFRLHAKGWI